MTKPPITAGELRAAVERHRTTNHGRLPKASDETDALLGITWATVFWMMRHGARGWPGGTSFADWMAAEFPDCRRDFSDENLRAWTQSHRDNNGGDFPPGLLRVYYWNGFELGYSNCSRRAR